MPQQFVSVAEQKAIVAAQTEASILAAASAAGIVCTDLDSFAEALSQYTAVPKAATIKSWKAGSTTDWVLDEPYARGETANYGNAYNVGTYGGELYQKNGSVSQTVSVPHPGLYKLTLNALYRQGANVDCYRLGQAGFDNLSTAYVSINDTWQAQIPSWYSGCNGVQTPNSPDEATALIAQGRYAVELYAYIDESNECTISINVPNFTPLGWGLFTNFELTAYLSPVSASSADAQADVYDLTGCRLGHPRRGLYIVGGRKVLVK